MSWTDKELIILLKLVRKYGSSNYDKISRKVEKPAALCRRYTKDLVQKYKESA